jgi:hypothetical protein
MPPPSDAAIGWTPNALGPPVAQIVQTFTVTPASIPVIAASSFSTQGSRIIVLRRRLDFVELDSVTGTTFSLATVSGGNVNLVPMQAIISASNVSTSGYNTTQGLGVRHIGGAVDLLTISGIANTVGPTNRMLMAPGLTVTMGTFAVSGSGLMLRQNARPIYLGVAGTDVGNYVEISVACLVVIP